MPSYEEILAMRDRLLVSQPKAVFVARHFSNQGNDLAALSKVLDRYPNLYVDISARDYEIGREPRSAAKFLERYQDRVLFGTDQGLAKKMGNPPPLPPGIGTALRWRAIPGACYL